MSVSATHRLPRSSHLLAHHTLPARSAQAPHRPFHYPSPRKEMGNSDQNRGDVHSEETILFLFLSFGILIVLILILLLLAFQTYLSYRLTHSLLSMDGDDDGGDEASKAGLRAWERERRERKRALRALEKGRGRASWGYGSGARASRGDEEMGMRGARGSSLVLDKMGGQEKKPFWSVKRWM